MYNNYPPGVRESDIPGYDQQEHVEHRTCGATEITLQVVDVGQVAMAVRDALGHIKRHQNGDGDPGRVGIPLLDRAVNRLTYAAKLVNEEMLQADADCPFEGEVEVTYGGGTWGWECPLCGTEHQGEIERDY